MQAFPFQSEFTGYKTVGSLQVPVFDRAADSVILRSLFKQIFTDGISRTSAADLQVIADQGMNVKINAGGGGLIDGTPFYNDIATTLTLDNADTANPRIDVIAIRKSDEHDLRNVEIISVKGTPAAQPTAPVLTSTITTQYLILAQVYVGRGVTAITQANITDTRLNTDLCGLMSPKPYPADTTAYYNQIQAALEESLEGWDGDFTAWFEGIQQTLNESTAGNLYNQIIAKPDIVICTADNQPPYVEGQIVGILEE